MYHQVWHSEILRSAHTVYLCVVYGSQNKQRLFPYTTLTDWFIWERLNPSSSSGYYMYHHVWHSEILRSTHTVYLCVVYGSQKKQRLFPCTALTDWVFNRDGECLLCGSVRVWLAVKVALGQVFLQAFLFCPVSINPLGCMFMLSAALTRRTNGRSQGTFQITVLFRKSEIIGQAKCFHSPPPPTAPAAAAAAAATCPQKAVP